jgi:hypothetical protein
VHQMARKRLANGRFAKTKKKAGKRKSRRKRR